MKIIWIIFILIFLWVLFGRENELNNNDPSNFDYVNIYSTRKSILLDKVFNSFTAETGIKVNVVVDKSAQLIARLKEETHNPKAQLFIAADTISMERATWANVLQPFDSTNIRNVIGDEYIDDNDFWVAFTARARLIFYNKKNINPSLIDNYLDLAMSKYKNKILIRSSYNLYNQSLISYLLYNNDYDKVLLWAKGLVNNFARHPKGGDTDQLKALIAGEGEVAIANSYYYARLMNSGAMSPRLTKTLRENIGVLYPKDGVNINVSGVAIVGNIQNKALKLNAQKLLEYLLSHEMQEIFVRDNYEYSVLEGFESPKFLKPLSDMKYNRGSIKNMHHYRDESLSISNYSRWN